jgi:hypothetical protein
MSLALSPITNMVSKIVYKKDKSSLMFNPLISCVTQKETERLRNMFPFRSASRILYNLETYAIYSVIYNK